MNKKRRNFKHSNEMSLKKLTLRSFWFSIVFLILGLVILTILSWVFYRMDDPTSKIELIGLISIYSSALISSFIQAKVNGQYYFLGGLFLGMIIFFTNILFSLFFPIDNTFSISRFIWRILVIVVCVLGSMLGAKRSDNKKRHLRKF